jgi:tRNA(adenine34) deaminase
MISVIFSEIDHHWMQHAISLAKKASEQGEVPVGAVLVLDGKIIAEGWNCPIGNCDPTAHAEIIALRAGAQALANYRLLNTTLYVTLEPCVMCVGAIVHARVKQVIYGAADLKSGAVTSALPLAQAQAFNHSVHYQGGLLNVECGALLSEFFRERRL